MIKKLWMSMMLLLCLPPAAFCAQPLITEDTATQGRGKFQVEMHGQVGMDREEQTDETGVPIVLKSRVSEIKTVLTYGLVDSADVILAAPYQWNSKEMDDISVFDENGFSDISIDLKWRFFERDRFSFAIKPGITLPVGDDERYLGTGRMTLSLYVIATAELDPLVFHCNLGYIRNENKIDQRVDLYHASLAGEWKVSNKLRLVANAGVEENTDRTSSEDRAFVLGGVIYSPVDRLDLDAGMKMGITREETDYIFMGGVTFRF